MKKKRIRLNLNVTVAVKDRIDALIERSECENTTAVVRRALSLLDLLMTEKEAGGVLVIHRADGTERELVFVE